VPFPIQEFHPPPKIGTPHYNLPERLFQAL
jgi:hypothetical protein